MSAHKNFPLLWEFFGGAFSVNSGGHAEEKDFAVFDNEALARAERELHDFLISMGCSTKKKQLEMAYSLGWAADGGYTVHGQTMQDPPPGMKGDDDEHKLYAFTLLDMCY